MVRGGGWGWLGADGGRGREKARVSSVLGAAGGEGQGRKDALRLGLVGDWQGT